MPTQQDIQQQIQGWVPNSGAGGGNPNTVYNNPPVPMSDALGNWVTPTVGPAASITPQAIPQRSVTLTPAQFPQLNIQPQQLNGWVSPPYSTPLFPNLGGGAVNQPGAGWGVTRPPTSTVPAPTPVGPVAPAPTPAPAPSGNVAAGGGPDNLDGSGWFMGVDQRPREDTRMFPEMAWVTYDNQGNATYDFDAGQKEVDATYTEFEKIASDPKALQEAGITQEGKSWLESLGSKFKSAFEQGGMGSAVMQVLDVISEPVLPGNLWDTKTSKFNWKNLVLGIASKFLGPLKLFMPLLSKGWDALAGGSGGGEVIDTRPVRDNGWDIRGTENWGIDSGGSNVWNNRVSVGELLPSVSVGLQGGSGRLDPIGGGSTQGGCVVVSSYVHQMPIAGEIEVGDIMPTIDPVEGVFSPQEVTYAETKLMPCVEIVTSGGVRLECSTTAPIADVEGNQILAPKLLGVEIPVYKHGSMETEVVMEVNDIGDKLVRHITCGDKFFLSGKEEGLYLFHHNAKASGGSDAGGMTPEEIAAWLWQQSQKQNQNN